MSEKRTFVLVHGAWHGGWCYRDVAAILRRDGHTVFTPTLTGLGERSHLASATVGLDTHVQDIVNVLLWEELADVVLVGHSYGGMVITGVADQAPDRIAQLVYLDAFVPARDGDSLLTLMEAGVLASIKSINPDGWSVPPPPPEVFGVAAERRDWVARRCVPQPFRTNLQGVRVTERLGKIPRSYVLATKWGGPENATPFRAFYETFKSDDAWTARELACGHDVMVDMPDETAALLETLAFSGV